MITQTPFTNETQILETLYKPLLFQIDPHKGMGRNKSLILRRIQNLLFPLRREIRPLLLHRIACVSGGCRNSAKQPGLRQFGEGWALIRKNFRFGNKIRERVNEGILQYWPDLCLIAIANQTKLKAFLFFFFFCFLMQNSDS